MCLFLYAEILQNFILFFSPSKKTQQQQNIKNTQTNENNISDPLSFVQWLSTVFKENIKQNKHFINKQKKKRRKMTSLCDRRTKKQEKKSSRSEMDETVKEKRKEK